MIVRVVSSAAAPAAVTLQAVKDHCRIGHDADDPRLTGSVIPAATGWAELFTGRALVNRAVVLSGDAIPAGPLTLPIAPVSAVTAIRVYLEAGDPVVIPAAAYTLEATLEGDPVIRWGASIAWPAAPRAWAPLELEVIAGYGATETDVPRALAQAVLLVCESIVDASGVIPEAARALARLYRREMGIG